MSCAKQKESKHLVVDPSIPYGPERHSWKDTISRYAVNPDFEPDQDPPVPKFLVKPPSNDPVAVYPKIGSEIGANDWDSFNPKYQVPSTGLSKAEIDEANALALARNKKFHENVIGYQTNHFFDYTHLKEFMTMHMNNIGDPYVESNFQANTRWIERNVLDYYASLWNIDWPHAGWKDENKESYWGYCLTMGSTEGNMYGLWNARDYLSGKELIVNMPTAQPKSKTARAPSCFMVQAELEDKSKQKAAEIPIAFYSEDAHYSLTKTVALLQILTFYQAAHTLYPDEKCPLEGYKEWPHEVPAMQGPDGVSSHFGPGAVDIKKLAQLVGFFTSKGHPAIVILNYGSTFKGAYDNVEEAGNKIMEELKKQPVMQPGDDPLHHYFYVNYEDQPRRHVKRLRVWIHVDGALGATFMPFLEMAYRHGKTTLEKLGIKSGDELEDVKKFPAFDFRLPFVCSINTSGHKWPGSPWACGIFMTRSKLVVKPPTNSEYVGSPDTTFAGSRNAFSPLILWNYISTHSYDDQVEAVLRCLDRVDYIFEELRKLQQYHGDLWVEKSPLSLTIRFKKPNDQIIQKYSLGTDTLRDYDENGSIIKQHIYAHIFIMQTTTEKQISDFLADLQNDPNPFPAQETTAIKPAAPLALGKLISKPLMLWPTDGRGYH